MADHSNTLILGDNLKLLREGDKLAVEDMAKIMKISTVSYERLEQGIIPKHITVDSIFYVAEYFEL